MADEVPLLDLIADDELVETTAPGGARPVWVVVVVLAVSVVASLALSALPTGRSESRASAPGLALVVRGVADIRVVDLGSGREVVVAGPGLGPTPFDTADRSTLRVGDAVVVNAQGGVYRMDPTGPVPIVAGRAVGAGDAEVLVRSCDPIDGCGLSLVGVDDGARRQLPPLPDGISVETSALFPDSGLVIVAGREPREGPSARHAYALIDDEWLDLGGRSATALVRRDGRVVPIDSLSSGLRAALVAD